MNKISCIVVDDEPASREILESYISDCKNLDLISSCSNAMDANEILQKNEVDLIFLDIRMPKISGIRFYRSLKNPPQVIFTTAYPEYALEGFEVEALDYLLKPFAFDRFLKAINKASRALGASEAEDQNDFVMLRSDKKLYRISKNEIDFLESMGDYVKVNYRSQHIIVHGTMTKLLEQIACANLIRVHKSFAVNLDKFEHLEGNSIWMAGKRIPLGQTYKDSLLERLKSEDS